MMESTPVQSSLSLCEQHRPPLLYSVRVLVSLFIRVVGTSSACFNTSQETTYLTYRPALIYIQYIIFIWTLMALWNSSFWLVNRSILPGVHLYLTVVPAKQFPALLCCFHVSRISLPSLSSRILKWFQLLKSIFHVRLFIYLVSRWVISRIICFAPGSSLPCQVLFAVMDGILSSVCYLFLLYFNIPANKSVRCCTGLLSGSFG